MKRFVVALVVLSLMAVVPAGASDDDWGKSGYQKGFKLESADKKFTMRISNRVQVRYAYVMPEGDLESIGSFRIRRFKFKMDGVVYGHWKYKLQVNFAGTQLAVDNDVLEDAYFQYTKVRMAQPWMGQGKPFFMRQRLTSSGKQQFIDRSIVAGEFGVQRQIGVGLTGKNKSKTFEYGVGLYNGNGRNFKVNDNNEYMVAGRAVWMPFGEYKLEESAFDYPDRVKFAVGVDFLTNTETDRDDDGNITDETDLRVYGIEAAFKIGGFNAVGEYYLGQAGPSGGDLEDIDGGYIQAAYLFPGRHWEVALRYATLNLDSIGDFDEKESGIAVNYYVVKHNYKWQFDYRRLTQRLGTDIDTDEIRLQAQISF